MRASAADKLNRERYGCCANATGIRRHYIQIFVSIKRRVARRVQLLIKWNTRSGCQRVQTHSGYTGIHVACKRIDSRRKHTHTDRQPSATAVAWSSASPKIQISQHILFEFEFIYFPLRWNTAFLAQKNVPARSRAGLFLHFFRLDLFAFSTTGLLPVCHFSRLPINIKNHAHARASRTIGNSCVCVCVRVECIVSSRIDVAHISCWEFVARQKKIEWNENVWEAIEMLARRNLWLRQNMFTYATVIVVEMDFSVPSAPTIATNKYTHTYVDLARSSSSDAENCDACAAFINWKRIWHELVLAGASFMCAVNFVLMFSCAHDS